MVLIEINFYLENSLKYFFLILYLLNSEKEIIFYCYICINVIGNLKIFNVDYLKKEKLYDVFYKG